MVGDVGPAPRVEDVERVREAVAGERQHGLVHHHDRRLAVRHRPPGGVAQRRGRARSRRPGASALSRGRHGEAERARRGGTGRSRLPLAKAGRAGAFAPARRLLARRRPTRSTWTCTLGVNASSIGIASVCEPPAIVKRSSRTRPQRRSVRTRLGGGEGRQHEHLRHVARAVLLPVGDERHLLLLEVAARRHPPAGHPDPQLRLVLAAPLVGDAGEDAPGAALLRLEAHPHRLRRGRDLALLDVLRDLLPLALDLLPVEPLGPQRAAAGRRRRRRRGRWRSTSIAMGSPFCTKARSVRRPT